MEHLILGLYVLIGVGFIGGIALDLMIINVSKKQNDELWKALILPEESEDDQWKRPS
jgi:hypothetical protein